MKELAQSGSSHVVLWLPTVRCAVHQSAPCGAYSNRLRSVRSLNVENMLDEQRRGRKPPKDESEMDLEELASHLGEYVLLNLLKGGQVIDPAGHLKSLLLEVILQGTDNKRISNLVYLLRAAQNEARQVLGDNHEAVDQSWLQDVEAFNVLTRANESIGRGALFPALRATSVDVVATALREANDDQQYQMILDILRRMWKRLGDRFLEEVVKKAWSVEYLPKNYRKRLTQLDCSSEFSYLVFEYMRHSALHYLAPCDLRAAIKATMNR